MTVKPNAMEQLFHAIASGDGNSALQLIDESPTLATTAVTTGATRKSPTSYFLDAIERQVYAGDTALHIAAAAYQTDIARALIARGAYVGARNRLGAQPLHYAAVGNPSSARWNPEAQSAVIEHLIRAGAEVDAVDKNGSTPLHRAVRTRCAEAVRALLANAADARKSNGSGSTPLHLAVQNTGRGGSGSTEAKVQQVEIIRTLLAHGAAKSDTDERGQIFISAVGE